MKPSFVAWLLPATLIFLLTGCAPHETAQQAVNSALTAVVEHDVETAAAYFGDGVISEADATDISSFDLLPLIAGQLTWELSEVKERRDRAAMTLTLTNRDMAALMPAFQKTLYQHLATRESPPEGPDELRNLSIFFFTVMIQDSFEPTVTTAVPIELNYVDGHWRITSSVELLNALYGGLPNYLAEKEED